MPFTRKGERRAHAAGRRRGTPNRLGGDLRLAILSALSKAGAGDPEAHLVACATDDDPRVRSAFLGLVGRCLPKELKVEDGGPLLIIRDYSGRSTQVERHEEAS